MGLFGSKKSTPQPQAAQVPAPAAPEPAPAAGGVVSLSKGQSVSLSKAAPGVRVEFSCSWPDKTDYDLFALVEYADGRVEHVATFGADGVPAASATRDGAVAHGGDMARGSGRGTSSESIVVNLRPDMRTIVPVVYSAQSNGTGSFRRYQVTSSVVCGSQAVTIDARNADSNDRVYSLVPGVVHFDGQSARLEAVELYSRPGSEDRPAVAGGVVKMNVGPRNDYK